MASLRMVLAVSGMALAVVPAAAHAAGGGPGHALPTTDAEMITNALSAAPAAVVETATIVAMNEKGEMRTLRQGAGLFTCMPDNPTTPGNDPMCLDKNGMAWAQAWMEHKEPPRGQVGLGYMLAGGSDASNDDPYAKAPAAGRSWIDTGPHVMILNATEMMRDHPRTAENPRAPYVMWGSTPYAHVMMPVGPLAEQTAEVPSKK